MAGMYCMKDLLELVLREKADGLYLRAGNPPILHLRGERLGIQAPSLEDADVAELLQGIANPAQLEELRDCGDARFVYLFQKSRFSVAATVEGRALAVNIRHLGG